MHRVDLNIQVSLDFLTEQHLCHMFQKKKHRSPVLIPSLQCAAELDKTTSEKQKLSIVTFYNKTKGGVNKVDKNAKMYSTSRKNYRWPLTLFFHLLDIAGIIAMVILTENGVVIKKRRMYLRELEIELTRVRNEKGHNKMPTEKTTEKYK